VLRRLAAEGLGSLLLAAAVIGSGIMAERLAAGNLAVVLIANSGATVAVLATLIALLGPVSGPHLNPAVSTSFANPAITIARALSNTFAGISPSHVPVFVLAQLLGALTAIPVAKLLFANTASENVPDPS
jgi:glycerol uptake facilitator-like aquaporin